MVAGLARTLETGRLVEREIQVLMKIPRVAMNRERKAFGLQRRVEIGYDFATYRNLSFADQRPARLARAEPLRLQNTIERKLTQA